MSDIKYVAKEFDQIVSDYSTVDSQLYEIKNGIADELKKIKANWTGAGIDIEKRDEDFSAIDIALENASNEIKEVTKYLSAKNEAFSETHYG